MAAEEPRYENLDDTIRKIAREEVLKFASLLEREAMSQRLSTDGVVNATTIMRAWMAYGLDEGDL